MPLSLPFSLPAGCMAQFAGSVAPEGWAFAYGQALSRAAFSALFSAIGTTYGSGDGSTTFNVPDMRGRLPVGKDDMGGGAANRVTTGNSGINGVALGASGGAEVVTLSAAQMPSHTHNRRTGVNDDGGGTGSYIDMATDYAANRASEGAGSSGAHSNMPPALVINYIIKT